MDPFYLGAYWGSRQESSRRCGERLATCISRLAEVDEALASWFRRGSSKADAKTPVDLDSGSLGRLLAEGVNRRDVGGDVIEELGFSIGLWNRARPAVSMSGTVGAHPSFQGVLNSLVLDFPPPQAEALRLYEPSVAASIFDVIVEAWEPDWATWSNPALRSAQDPAAREPVLGWMTYLAAPVAVELPAATSRRLLGGTVITIGQHVRGAGEREVIDSRGMLAMIGALRPIA